PTRYCTSDYLVASCMQTAPTIPVFDCVEGKWLAFRMSSTQTPGYGLSCFVHTYIDPAVPNSPQKLCPMPMDLSFGVELATSGPGAIIDLGCKLFQGRTAEDDNPRNDMRWNSGNTRIGFSSDTANQSCDLTITPNGVIPHGTTL